jgi:hypothetical protein
MQPAADGRACVQSRAPAPLIDDPQDAIRGIDEHVVTVDDR